MVLNRITRHRHYHYCCDLECVFCKKVPRRMQLGFNNWLSGASRAQKNVLLLSEWIFIDAPRSCEPSSQITMVVPLSGREMIHAPICTRRIPPAYFLQQVNESQGGTTPHSVHIYVTIRPEESIKNFCSVSGDESSTFRFWNRELVRIGRPQTPPERLAAATGAESRRFGGRREGARRPAPKARGCYESCIFHRARL